MVIAIVGVLVALLLPVLSRARQASRQVNCLSNLRQIGTAFRMYSQDEGQLPYPAFTQIPWERSLSQYLTLDLFRCPSDAELGPVTGSSYDWRNTGVAETTLAGKSIREARRPDTLLAFDALPGWHQKGRMNIVTTDGSAASLLEQDALLELDVPISPPSDVPAAMKYRKPRGKPGP